MRAAAIRSTNCCTWAARLSELLGSPRSVTTTSAVRPPRGRLRRRAVRAVDRLDGRQPADAGFKRRDRPRGLRRAERERDQHVLGGRALQARGGQPRVRAGRLANPEPEFDSVRIPASRTGRDARDDQREPERDGRLRDGAPRSRAARWTKRASRPGPTVPPDVVDEGVICMSADCRRGPPKSLGRAGVWRRRGPPFSDVGITPPRTDPEIAPPLPCAVSRCQSAR